MIKRKLKMQSLENRSLMAADFGFSNGIITATGNNGDNNISFDLVGDQVVVSMDKCTSSYDLASVVGIVASGGNGNDTISNNTGINSMLRGGNGNDTLKGGTGNDNMFGDNGDDIITDFAGGGGSNLLDGGNGNDSLWGGFGAVSDHLTFF